MLQNYIKIALRHLLKNPVYSLINIAGLTIGLATAILIYLWVTDELSFDRFHKKYDNLYQVYMNQEFASGIGTQNALPHPLKETIKSKSSQVKYIAITNWGEGNLLTVGDRRYNKIGLSVSEDFLRMFTFSILQGGDNSLQDPNSIVLTESTARDLFGDADPMNQLIKIDNDRDLKVSGIIKDVPTQSTFKFDYLLPFGFYEATQLWVRNSINNWDNNSFQMYVELIPNTSLTDANKSIQNLVKENNKDSQSAQVFLHPMNKWRLYSKFENGKSIGGNIEYVELFTLIAIFILVIACINFMNLATARSESRAREVGIRKSVGSRRKELVMQFLGESILLTLFAAAIALLIVELILPLYNVLVNKRLIIDYSNPVIWLSAAALILITGFVAGSYPAFYLSSFQPVKVLKGKVQVGKDGSTPRKVLVTLQFGFSILLIIGTIVIYQQIQHVKAREMGYDRENLMLIWTNTEIETGFQTIKEELVRTGSVKSVCKSNSPVTRIFSSNTVEWPGMPDGPPVSFTTIATEYDYTQTLGIKMLEGRDFSREFKSDSSALIINKAAADLMGMENTLGSKIKFWGSEWPVIGIMENVVMGSPYEPVKPLVMVFNPSWSSTIAVRLQRTEDLPSAISSVESVFRKYNPEHPFAYRFADTEFETKFSTINLISQLALIFASLAILITCLGLFGLAAFTAEQRTKEIGIRKVMGATVMNLVILINKDFSRLVIIAFIISAPLAWWALDGFLQRYPYRITISWWVLPAVGLLALTIALIIVSTQAIRAATSNPAKSLKNE